MAKKRRRGRRGENKSGAIRAYLAEHPEAPAKQVVEALAQQGVRVSEAVVYNTRSQVRREAGQPAKRRGRPRKAAGAAAAPAAKGRARGGEASLEDVYAAKQLVDQLGGIDQTRRALDALERLR